MAPWFRPAVARGALGVIALSSAPQVYFIKRIAGVPGDTLSMRGGRLYVDSRLVDTGPVSLNARLSSEELASMEQWQRLGETPLDRGHSARNVELDDLLVAEVHASARPDAAGPVAPQVAHCDQDASAGERFGKGRVVAGFDTHRADEQERRVGMVRFGDQKLECVAVIGPNRPALSHRTRIV